MLETVCDHFFLSSTPPGSNEVRLSVSNITAHSATLKWKAPDDEVTQRGFKVCMMFHSYLFILFTGVSYLDRSYALDLP